MSKFGEYIKRKRLASQLTLREFCLRYGYDAGNHSKLERGLLLPPKGDKLEKLASDLGFKLSKPYNCFDTKHIEDYYTFIELAEFERQPLLEKIQTLQAENARFKEREKKWRECVEFYTHEKIRDGYDGEKVYGVMMGHRYDIACGACNEENKGKIARETLKELESGE